VLVEGPLKYNLNICRWFLKVRRVLEERQLKGFGHVYRMEREKKPKQFMEAQVEGRKQRARQRITFESRIEEINSRRGKTLAEMKKMARDREVRKTWRKDPRRCNGTTRTEKKKKNVS
jgi:hypothetical protein